MANQKRFSVALSFPGERRAFVEQVADRLSVTLGRDRVLYDRYHEPEFAQPDLDIHLQGLYHDESELVVLFLSADYERKEWCGLEWRAIRDLLKRRRTAAIMLLRFDDTEIPGLFSIDGYAWIGDRTPEQTAELILERLRRNREREQASGGNSAQRVAPSRLKHAAVKLFGREDDLARLDAAWDSDATNVLTVVAWGGIGKTSLVARWAADLAVRGYDGAWYFDWSFHSQGARAQGEASADPFIASALEFFGDAEMANSARPGWSKGARLAELLAERPTLLILDGLEPLQHPPGPLGGTLRDDAVLALLRGLAQRNPGLCVVTTRESVTDLASARGSTVVELHLQRLSTIAGTEFLKALGVRGTAQEFEQLVTDVHGHALTLNLLGRFLVDAHDGDIRRRDQVQLEEADAELQAGHAWRAMEAYEQWLASGGRPGERQLALLRLLGLFDRPADEDALAALRREPAIPGLTEPLVGLGEAAWNLTLSTLASRELISLRSIDGAQDQTAVDTHPLVREYFARNLQRHNRDAWVQAHSRLYEYLRDSVEELPDTLIGLQPLYQAVAHGCRADRHEEALTDVYWARIQRRVLRFSTYVLGATGADLAAVANFFDEPWRRVSPHLSESDRGFVLSEAVYSLRALGRIAEAREPARTTVEARVAAGDDRNAALSFANLSGLELISGNIAAAEAVAREGVPHAERTGDEYCLRVVRSSLAEALFNAGRFDEALALSRELEARQAGADPQHPLLYSVSGFQHCAMLLRVPEGAAWKALLAPNGTRESAGSEPTPVLLETCREVHDRAAQTLTLAKSMNWLLDEGLDHLTIVRALLYGASIAADTGGGEPRPGAASMAEMNEAMLAAIEGLRHAGEIVWLPAGLLTSAWVNRAAGDNRAACANLDEAWEIALRGPMRLHLADIHLYRSCLFHAVNPYPWEDPHKDLAAARKLIGQCGYWRRKEELEAAEAAAAQW